MGNKLTIKERKLITEYVKNGGNGTQAALVAYDAASEDDAASIASRTLKKPSVAEALRDELERQGVTAADVVNPVAEGLHATKQDGSADFSTRLAAHDRAVKILHGLDSKGAEKDGPPAINFNINRANFGGEFVQNDED